MFGESTYYLEIEDISLKGSELLRYRFFEYKIRWHHSSNIVLCRWHLFILGGIYDTKTKGL